MGAEESTSRGAVGALMENGLASGWQRSWLYHSLNTSLGIFLYVLATGPSLLRPSLLSRTMKLNLALALLVATVPALMADTQASLRGGRSLEDAAGAQVAGYQAPPGAAEGEQYQALPMKKKPVMKPVVKPAEAQDDQPAEEVKPKKKVTPKADKPKVEAVEEKPAAAGGEAEAVEKPAKKPAAGNAPAGEVS